MSSSKEINFGFRNCKASRAFEKWCILSQSKCDLQIAQLGKREPISGLHFKLSTCDWFSYKSERVGVVSYDLVVSRGAVMSIKKRSNRNLKKVTIKIESVSASY